MKQRPTRLLILLFCFLWLFAGAFTAWSAEVSIPALQGAPGESIEIPVMVDRVDNLAGVKLVLAYDPEILTFLKETKTRHTDSLMHIVNSKKPGVLIAVMAGARGIQGKDFPLLIFTFQIRKDLKGNHTTDLSITHVEMMSDKLKAIPCEVRPTVLTITPKPEPKREESGKALSPQRGRPCDTCP